MSHDVRSRRSSPAFHNHQMVQFPKIFRPVHWILISLCGLASPAISTPTASIPSVLSPSSASTAIAMRVGSALANDRDLARIAVQPLPSAVRIRVGPGFEFEMDGDQPNGSGTALLARLARAFDHERGDVQVRTCVVPHSLTSHLHFRSEDDLAMARAEEISEIFSPLLSSPGRLVLVPSVAAEQPAQQAARNATDCDKVDIVLVLPK